MVADMPSRCVIGVDVGGTKVLAGAVDERLEVQHRTYRLVHRDGSAAVLESIVAAVEEIRDAAVGQDVEAVGLGIPALVDWRRGVAITSNHLPIDDLAIRDLLADRLDLPVAVDNDANCAMLAEWRYGAAAGTHDAVLLTLGTGIGGGVVVDDRLLRGAQGAGAELGHMVIDVNGPPCPGRCPNHGCLEALASGIAIGREGLRVARGAPDSALGRALAAGREVTGALVTELAHDGDPAARDILALVGERLGIGIGNLVNIFNPDVVVVGGGVIAAGELLLAPAREAVARRALSPARESVRIVPARFGAESGMLGAAALAFEAVGVG
jgi:glucokinase